MSQFNSWIATFGLALLAVGVKGIAQAPASFEKPNAMLTEQKGKGLTVTLSNETKMEFVYVPAAKFRMGGTYLSGPAFGLYAAMAHGSMHPSDEGPYRETTISKAFYILDTKVTSSCFADFLNEAKNTSDCIHFTFFQRRPIFKDDRGMYSTRKDCSNAMVDFATFAGATRFCEWLSDRTKRRCRLPTEAEWEYVAKGKESRRFPWGDKEPGIETYGFSLNEVRRFPYLAKEFPKNATPNGIYDMGGWIQEWCSDWYADRYDKSQMVDPQGPNKGTERIVRGFLARTTSRQHRKPDQYSANGFRVVIEE